MEKEQGVNINALRGWNKCVENTRLDFFRGQEPRQQNREQEKIARLKEENEFLGKYAFL